MQTPSLHPLLDAYFETLSELYGIYLDPKITGETLRALSIYCIGTWIFLGKGLSSEDNTLQKMIAAHERAISAICWCPEDFLKVWSGEIQCFFTAL